jgi:hypothetical protein
MSLIQTDLEPARGDDGRNQPSPEGANHLRHLVHRRASQLAALARRPRLAVSQSDYEQAKRELTGERDLDRQQFVLNADSGHNWPA